MVKLTLIEGTPEEVLAVARGLEARKEMATSESVTAAPTQSDDGERAFVSTEVARKVLNRRPLSPEQKIVLSTLAKASPDLVPAADLQAATGYTPAQFAGLMGAFGRRLTHTDGYVPDTWLFDPQWNYDKGAYDYRLPDTVVEAVKSEKLI